MSKGKVCNVNLNYINMNGLIQLTCILLSLTFITSNPLSSTSVNHDTEGGVNQDGEGGSDRINIELKVLLSQTLFYGDKILKQQCEYAGIPVPSPISSQIQQSTTSTTKTTTGLQLNPGTTQIQQSTTGLQLNSGTTHNVLYNQVKVRNWIKHLNIYQNQFDAMVTELYQQVCALPLKFKLACHVQCVSLNIKNRQYCQLQTFTADLYSSIAKLEKKAGTELGTTAEPTSEVPSSNVFSQIRLLFKATNYIRDILNEIQQA